MLVITPQLIQGKKILLRMDLDVPLENSKLVVKEDFRLRTALPTLNMCLEYGEEVIVMGHLGRPEGKEVPELSVEPIYDWFWQQGLRSHIESGKLKLLENLRFEKGESFDTAQDKEDVLRYAKELAALGDIYINEAFAAHHKAASTTVLPTLLPHATGLRFAEEVEKLSRVKDSPQRPLVAIIGGVKVEDKYPAALALSKFCDVVLVGGLVADKIKEQNLEVGKNMMLGKLSEDRLDLAPETVESFIGVIKNAKQVIWAGPVGKYEDPQGSEGSKRLAQAIIESKVESIVGGGDTVGFLGELGLLERFGFVSTGGGAMLKFLTEGALPTIEALKD